MKAVLSIAGSDCSGGAGIQADIKSIMANGGYAMSVITALTAQNTCGVIAIQPSTPAFLAQQLDAVFTDIFPDAVKIGMLFSADLMRIVAEKLVLYKPKNIVLDPVMVATSGDALMHTEALEALKTHLLPLAHLMTPNIPEAEALVGKRLGSVEAMEEAAQTLQRVYHCAVLIKGGHSQQDANDVLCDQGRCVWFKAKRIEGAKVHGTGCTLSSAIATYLAKGLDLVAAIRAAKTYLSGILQHALAMGKGSNVLPHAGVKQECL
ncbi:MAG: bifunctional hydroxymethylpyrimidine kinase/phosphomethylpyrimidine kinase [Opitutales bacterium]|nr:bifunctional hydroxymethylpyrimidine kinase/phosphomethylpyrimidine kinase [Opitutales bacterium]